MYIFKNALRCIGRAKGRNILIGIIALVIAISACIGLSIQQAAKDAKADALDGLTITATISYDRQSVMNNIMGGGSREPGQGFDKDSFSQIMGSASSLTLEEYKNYAQAETVKDFYYTLTAALNGSDDVSPVSTSTEEEEEQTDTTESNGSDSPFGGSGFGGGFGPGGNMMMGGNMFGGSFVSGDFNIVGYSSESAMTDFQNSVASIVDGTVFTEGTDALECIITEELAAYNDLSVGDTITLINPGDEEETYTLTITGIYASSASNNAMGNMFSTSQDPANQICMSAAALQKILDASEASSESVTDETTGRTYDTAISGSLSSTYVFASSEDYEQFQEDVYTMGLDESYTVSSSDVASYESSLTPLNTLSTMAGWFLLVILIIGAVILVVLNIFNVRERKYEIGVLTAMGMKKGKVALQFIAEILVVTMIAIMIGTVIGAVCAVPVTNALLENQISSQQAQQNEMNLNFGKGEMPQGMGGNGMTPPGGSSNFFGDMFNNTAEYITEVDSAVNLTVVLQMVGIGLLLTLFASAFSVLFVMRYDPLKILANRD